MKLPVLETMMDCLYASCNIMVTDCKFPPSVQGTPRSRNQLTFA